MTGVQARLQTPGASLLAQRDIDAEFRSVFIANAKTGLEPVAEVADLSVLAGRRFTFGSESSTSGRLMPAYFLSEAGIDPEADLAGRPGFSGSHDATIDLVQSGSYEAGALNQQVWQARKDAGTVDLDAVVEVFTTPTYADYHWLGGPGLDERMGAGFTDQLRGALLALDGSTPEEAEVLEAYGAGALVPTEAAHYDRIEEIGRALVETRDLHPREAVRALADRVLAATGGELVDDATVLCLDWHGDHGRDRETQHGAEQGRASGRA